MMNNLKVTMPLLHVYVYLRECTQTSIAYSTSLSNSLMAEVQTAFMSSLSICRTIFMFLFLRPSSLTTIGQSIFITSWTIPPFPSF
jgi:hypothetical protein